MIHLQIILHLFLTLILTEYLSKTSMKKLRLHHPLYFMVDMVLLSMLILFFYGISGNLPLSIMLPSGLMLALALAGKIKADYRQVGFTPVDFLILREAGSMAGALNPKATGALLMKTFGIAMVLTLSGIRLADELLSRFSPINLSPMARIGMILAFLGVLTLFYLVGPWYQYRISVYETGSLFYFLSFLRDPPRISIEPKGDIPTTLSTPPVPLGLDGPDIIILQSESFSDPLNLESAFFNEDPIPFYHALQKVSHSFNMSTRAFGGGTVHTEYEILTGLSTLYFPRDTTVFSRYLKRPIISLGSILKTLGYHTLMLHPYHDWYYNRKTAYRHLGFDEFRTISAFDPSNTSYVNDKEINRTILKELEDKTDQPQLIFAVTMQNHTPYKTMEYPHQIRYQGPAGSLETHQQFNHYLNGLRESDEALQELVQALSKRKRETILLFYGDHLPVINQDADFYQSSQWSHAPFDSDRYYWDLSLSPGLIWSNQRTLSQGPALMDCTRVAGQLLGHGKIPHPSYFDEMEDLHLRHNLQGIFRSFLRASDRMETALSPTYRTIYRELQDINQKAFAQHDTHWHVHNTEYTIR